VPQVSLSHNEEAHHFTSARVMTQRRGPHTESEDDRGYLREPKGGRKFPQTGQAETSVDILLCLTNGSPFDFGLAVRVPEPRPRKPRRIRRKSTRSVVTKPDAAQDDLRGAQGGDGSINNTWFRRLS